MVLSPEVQLIGSFGRESGLGCPSPPWFSELVNSIPPQEPGVLPKIQLAVPLSKGIVNLIRLWSTMCFLSHWSIILRVVVCLTDAYSWLGCHPIYTGDGIRSMNNNLIWLPVCSPRSDGLSTCQLAYTRHTYRGSCASRLHFEELNNDWPDLYTITSDLRAVVSICWVHKMKALSLVEWILYPVYVCVCVCACVCVWLLYVCYSLQVSCASEGEVAITVGQTEVLCQSAGQEVRMPGAVTV